MLFVLTGYFQAGVTPKLDELHDEFNEHLMQRTTRVRFGGPLHASDGARIGMLLIVEAADHAAAEAFLHDSPYHQAGLYERVDLSEIRPEVGSLN